MKEAVQHTFNLNDAMLLAVEYHRYQKDRVGKPYTEHIFAVTSQVQGEYSKMTGVLHDIVEDTPMTFEKLRSLGCPETVIKAVELLTHKNPQPTYEEYMEDIKKIAESGNQIAIDVKWADLTHNSDLSRLKKITDRDKKRTQKYLGAKEILRPHVSSYLLVRA